MAEAKREAVDRSGVSPTGWALLALLSGDDEFSGYDIRKWIGWSIRFFYSNPAYSQIYSELKRLERLGFLSSRVEAGARNRRLYRITPEGLAAVIDWINNEPVEPPALKHNALLRVMLGHLVEPDKLREMLTSHADYAEQMEREAALEVRWMADQPGWSYARLALKWAEEYYADERQRALRMIKDLDAADESLQEGAGSVELPMRKYWYDVERRIAAAEGGDA